jgi:hypothetical protein
MAKRPTSPAELREAVERTVQATLGSAERQRERTQGALDDLAGTVEQLRKGAEAGIARGRRVIGDRRPATSEDIRELKAELRRIGRRLDEIEDRLPAKRSRGGTKRSASGAGAKRSAGGGANRSAGGGAKASASGGGAKRSAGGGAKASAGGAGAKRSASGGRSGSGPGGQRSASRSRGTS